MDVSLAKLFVTLFFIVGSVMGIMFLATGSVRGKRDCPDEKRILSRKMTRLALGTVAYFLAVALTVLALRH
jgi:hypothetical protein